MDKYYTVEELIGRDRKVPLKRYYEVAGGEYVADPARLRAGARGRRGTASSATHEFGQRVVEELTPSGAKGPFRAASVRACVDVSDVDVVDRKGRSVVKKGRADAYVEHLTVTRTKSAGG